MRYYTTADAVDEVARRCGTTFTRQAWWKRVESLGMKPWREHGRKVWWSEQQVASVVGLRTKNGGAS